MGWPQPQLLASQFTEFTPLSMPQSSPHMSLLLLLQSTMVPTDQSMDMDTDRLATSLSASHTRENTEAPPRARLSVPTPPQLLPMLSMLPQLLPTPSTLLQLTMPQLQLTTLPQLTRPRLTPMRSPHTPTPTLLLMTTQRPPSTLRSSPMVPAMLLDLTPLLFPMAESNTSSTPPMVMMDMLLMSPMRVLLSTQRPQLHTRLPQLTLQPQLITLKPKIPHNDIKQHP